MGSSTESMIFSCWWVGGLADPSLSNLFCDYLIFGFTCVGWTLEVGEQNASNGNV